MEIHRSARKHGIADADIRHAVRNLVASADVEDESHGPWRVLLVGPDRAGNLLELVVLERDGGSGIVIHAMHLRPRYRWLLHEPGGRADG